MLVRGQCSYSHLPAETSILAILKKDFSKPLLFQSVLFGLKSLVAECAQAGELGRDQSGFGGGCGPGRAALRLYCNMHPEFRGIIVELSRGMAKGLRLGTLDEFVVLEEYSKKR